MRVVIIGGTGHIGSYLTPKLVEAGHSAICISRGVRQPYLRHSAWRTVTQLHVDRCAVEVLGYSSRYSSLEAVKESIQWMMQNGLV